MRGSPRALPTLARPRGRARAWLPRARHGSTSHHERKQKGKSLTAPQCESSVCPRCCHVSYRCHLAVTHSYTAAECQMGSRVRNAAAAVVVASTPACGLCESNHLPHWRPDSHMCHGGRTAPLHAACKPTRLHVPLSRGHAFAWWRALHWVTQGYQRARRARKHTLPHHTQADFR